MWCLHALADNRIVNGDQENTLWRREICSIVKIKNYSLMWVISLPRGCDSQVSAEVIQIWLQGSPPWEVLLWPFWISPQILDFMATPKHLLFIHSFVYSLTYLTNRIIEYRPAFPRCCLVIPMLLS